MTFRNRILEYGVKPADQFLAHPKNARIHPVYQREVMKSALDTVGFVAPVIEAKSGYLLDGHERVWQGLQNKNAPIPFVVVDVDEDEEAYVLATFDPITALANYDAELLDGLLREVNSDNEHVQKMLAELAAEAGLYVDETPQSDPTPQIDRASELQQTWQTEVGQLWTIGKHRLLVGDCTIAANVERLMAGEKVDLVFTDPPYKFQGYGGGFHTKEIRQDFKDKLAPLTDFDPQVFISQLSGIDWSSCIIFCSKDLLPQYFEWAKGYDFNLLVWHKTNPPPFINNMFLPDLEYMVAAHKPSKIFNSGLDYQDYSRIFTSDIHEGKDNVLASHPTMKPLALFARYIKVLSDKNGIVYDPFLGSGTTLVACEQLGRQGRGMELEPKYAAVILQRMSDMGLEPRLEGA